MKPLFSLRRSRRIAAGLLFVWLLALATGIANACLLQVDHARHGHLAQAEAQTGPAAAHASAGQDAIHEHATSPASQACLNFCAAEQTGLTKTGGEVSAPPALGPAAVHAVGAALCALDGPRPRPALADPAQAPPVAIRFLRLTI